MIFSHVLYQLSYLGAVPGERRLMAEKPWPVQPAARPHAAIEPLFLAVAGRGLGRPLIGGNAVIALEPAPEIDGLAARRAEGAVPAVGGLAADRAGAGMLRCHGP